MFSSISRCGRSGGVSPASISRSACATHATISSASASASAAVVWASQMRTSTVPNEWCGRTDHQSWVNSTIEPVRTSRSTYSAHASQPPNGSGMPQRGNDLVKIWVRAVCRPGVDPVDVRRVGRDRQQQRQHRPQPVADLDRAVGALDADVDLQRERVVAPGDVLEPVLDAVVVRRVDDVLLAGSPTAGACRSVPSRTSCCLGEREQPPARLLLLGARVGDVLAAAGADLDLGRDQLAGDRVGEHRVARAGVAQLLEPGDQLERLGMDERVFLLDPDREVLGGLEGLARSGEVDQVR